MRVALEREQAPRGDGGASQLRARDLHHRINEDDGGEKPSSFNRVS